MTNTYSDLFAVGYHTLDECRLIVHFSFVFLSFSFFFLTKRKGDPSRREQLWISVCPVSIFKPSFRLYTLEHLRSMASLPLALEQTEIPPELFMPFRGLRNTPLFFSDYCRKLTTHKGVTITRVIICTSEHLYLCHPNGDIMRCVPYAAITRVLHDERRHQLGIVVPCEFDIAVETPLSFQLLHVIDVLRRMHGARHQLDQVRVAPVPRPEGLLGFRPDGRPIWDQTLKVARRRRRHDQTCAEKCMDKCGLEDAWVGLKDTMYRQYRSLMRYLDLGIEDDDEVAMQSAAAMTAAASGSGAPMPGALGGAANTMMLAAGKTTFSLHRQSGSNSNISNSNINNNNSASGASSSLDEDGEGDAPSGYRWFRPVKGNKVRQQQDEEAAALASENEVLNLLLSPMLVQQEDQWGDENEMAMAGTPSSRNGAGAAGAAAAASFSAAPMSAEEKKKAAIRNQWWPGCQIGWVDGPYALSLAKPEGFKVALDQRNSEFA